MKLLINKLGIKISILLFMSGSLLPINTLGQCRTDLLLGQNTVTNGDFSQGYTGWTYTPDSDGDLSTGPDGYQQYTGSPFNYSRPGNIFVGTGSQLTYFNLSNTPSFNGHTTGAANDNFLFVDGVCVAGIKLWSQNNIPIVANTRYYFSVWVNSLHDQPNYPGILNFDVNGTNLATGIVAPKIGGGSVGGAWLKVEAFWDSGPTPPATATISIEGNQTVGCATESDFAIDDVSFIPGCSYGDPGPQPNLGPDQSLCGKGGSITLDANVPHLASTTVTWSDGTTGTGLLAPYTKVINAAGTYSVCVVDGSSCIKSDVIVISNTFTPNTTPNADLCGNPSAPLDAVFTGLGTTYQWKLNGVNLPAPSTNRTYTATIPGTYTVDVTVVGCGTVTSGNTVITSGPSAAPTTSPGANLCNTNPAPLDAVLTGAGITYQWKLNGANLPTPSTNRTYSAISPGNYTVDVKLPGCTTTTSATTVITSSSTITPINAFYCATLGPVSGLTLGATTASPNGPNLSWFTVPTGGTAIASGVTSNSTTSTYALPTIPMGTTGTQTYYVQDNTIATGTVGPTTIVGSDQNFYPSNLGNVGQYFTANQNLIINSVQIPIKITTNSGNMNISFNYSVLKANGSALSTPITGVTNVVTVPGTTAAYTFFTFNTAAINISQALALSDGPNFLLRITSRNTTYSDNNFRVAITNGGSYPYASTLGTSVASITAGYVYGSQSGQYGGLYNWNISSVSACTRTPVSVINNCVTPVTWTSFYLVPQSNVCKLVWNTANETNNSYFAVERSSDGIHFETIATITGAGNRNIASNYYYIDNASLSGTSYYRITQVDYNGSSTSTDMKAYSSEGLIQMTTYPNPFQNSTNLLVSGATADTYTYTIYAISGQLVEEGTGTINQLQTIGENQAKGMYMLTVITAGDIITNKIVKQ
jgi:hypothetical protein